MIKDRISEEWKIASPCQNDGDLICSILKYEVCTRSYIFLFFDYSYRNVAVKLYVFLIIWNSSKIYVCGGNGLNAQFVTFLFNNSHCLDFLLVVKEEWWAHGGCQLCSWVPVNCWCPGLMSNVRREGFFSLFPEMAQQAQLTDSTAAFTPWAALGSHTNLAKCWCGVMELVCTAVCPWVHSNLCHQLH